MSTHQSFLKGDALSLLQDLKEDAVAKFGILTPQHMVEHLIWVTKTTIGRKGEPEGAPTKSHLYFQKFINDGAIFQYRPKEGASSADLKPLKYGSLQEAIAQVAPAIDRLYQYYEENPGAMAYNPIMGELTQAQLELFHAQHYRWHLYQFGLIEVFA